MRPRGTQKATWRPAQVGTLACLPRKGALPRLPFPYDEAERAWRRTRDRVTSGSEFSRRFQRRMRQRVSITSVLLDARVGERTWSILAFEPGENVRAQPEREGIVWTSPC